MAVDPRGARLVQEDVGEDVGQVARDCDQAVVGVGTDRDRAGSERRDESVHASEPLGRGRRGRRHEPRGALEQVARGTVGATRLRPADRMPADEAGVVPGRGADGHLRRADVGDRAPLRRVLEDRAHRLRQLTDG